MIVYYDGGDHAKQMIVMEVLHRLAQPARFVDEHQGNETIGALFDGKETSNAEPVMLPSLDLMIFHEVTDDEIRDISQALREQGAHVERKCVVTEHNRAWRLVDLLKEIMEEHAYYQSFDACKQLISEVSTMEEHAYTKESWAVYQDAFMQALLQIQQGQPSKDQLEHMITQIQNAKQALVPVSTAKD